MSYKFEYNILEKEGNRILQYGAGGYAWQLIEVWQRKVDGKLFMAAGSGCSCNSLYDEIDSWEAMTPIYSFDLVRKELDQWDSNRPTATEVIEGMSLINHMKALAK